MPERSNDVTVYLVLNDYRTGLDYVETAADEEDRDSVIRNFLAKRVIRQAAASSRSDALEALNLMEEAIRQHPTDHIRIRRAFIIGAERVPLRVRR